MCDEQLKDIEDALRAIVLDDLQQQSIIDARSKLLAEIDIKHRKLPATHMAADSSRYNGESSVPRCDIGAMTERCRHFNAKYFAKELSSAGRFRLCCSEGEVKPRAMPPYPATLQRYLEDRKLKKAAIFRKYIMYLNNSIALGSYAARMHLNSGNNRGQRAPDVIHVNGLIHHTLAHSSYGDLLSKGQYYILNTDEATEERIANIAEQNTFVNREDVIEKEDLPTVRDLLGAKKEGERAAEGRLNDWYNNKSQMKFLE